MRTLDCPFCDHQNPAGARFCNDCGSPLHLTPCDQCGAVNNLTDTHCWRCGGLLLPLQSPARPVRSEHASGAPDRRSSELERSGALELASLELEQELEAIEQETRQLVQAPRPGEVRDETGGLRASDAPPLLDDVVAQRRTPRVLRSTASGPRRSGATRLFEASRAQRHEPWRALVGIASVVVFVAAIVGGGYLYYRLGAAPTPELSASPPPEPPRAKASIEPRAAREVSAAPEPVPAPAVASAATRVVPVGPPVASNAEKAPVAEPARAGGGAANIITQIGKGTSAPEPEPARVGSGAANIITQIGKGAAAPEPSCPPAVAALALCEWVVKANRQ